MKVEIIKTREYLDYLQEHYDNVQEAWKIIQDKCKMMSFIYDDFCWGTLDTAIKLHDQSKLSREEFMPYRRKFFPTEYEKEHYEQVINSDFKRAWKHHKKHNNHHWENWAKSTGQFVDLRVVHNVCDWMAIGMKFNDTAKYYYEKNKSKIKIPKWAENLIYDIFDCVYPET